MSAACPPRPWGRPPAPRGTPGSTTAPGWPSCCGPWGQRPVCSRWARGVPGGRSRGAPPAPNLTPGRCSSQTKDWWTYEFCYGRHIQQYHLEGDSGDRVALVTPVPPNNLPSLSLPPQSLRSRVTSLSSAITSLPSTGTTKQPRSVSCPTLGTAGGRDRDRAVPAPTPRPSPSPPGLQAAPAEAIPQPELRERLPLRPHRPRPRGRSPGKHRGQRRGAGDAWRRPRAEPVSPRGRARSSCARRAPGITSPAWTSRSRAPTC